MKRISIIIVTYHSEEHIYDCVQSIQKYADIPLQDIELIVVDNSQPSSLDMFERLKKQWGDDIILATNQKNGGYGQGNNVGIRLATAPVIMIMNPDVRLIMPVFKDVLTVFDRDPKTTIVGMRQMISSTQYGASFAATRTLPGWLCNLTTVLGNKLQLYSSRYMWFHGACFFINREKFNAIGLFDETNFMYGEENDIHYRLTKQFGSHMHYCSKLKYLHLTSERVPSAKQMLTLVKSDIYLFEKKGYTREQIIRHHISQARMQVLIKTIAYYLGLVNKNAPLLAKQTLDCYQQFLTNSDK